MDKVLITGEWLQISIQFSVDFEKGLSLQQIDETRPNLRDLGLHDEVEVD